MVHEFISVNLFAMNTEMHEFFNFLEKKQSLDTL